MLDHELRELRGLRDSLDALKSLEQGNDGLLNRAEARKKDQAIAELRRKAMAQEEAIGQWIEALDQKNALLKAKDDQLAELQGLNDRLHQQLDEASGKVDELDERLKETQTALDAAAEQRGEAEAARARQQALHAAEAEALR